MSESHTNNISNIVNSYKQSLKHRTIKASIWTMVGYGGIQVMRFGGNLVLTHLLVPKIIGLVTLLQTLIAGLEMFSDFGLNQSIIQNKEGNEPSFLNTVWTVQVCRGPVLWIGACLLAWPASWFYGESMLITLLPVVGINSIISGFNSTNFTTANRKLNLQKISLVNLGSYTLSLVTTITLAWLWHSVWAIVIGGIIGTLSKTILTHVAFDGIRNHFCWDTKAFRSITQFGRWIFLGTALTFLIGQGDRLLLGRFMDLSFLGVFTIASLMSSVFMELINSKGSAFLFPAYSELVREKPEGLYSALRRIRLILISSSWLVSLFFICFGQPMIDFFYDDHYHAAGWMLRLLALGSLVGILNISYNGVFLAKGRSDFNTFTLVLALGVKILAIVIGSCVGKQEGVIYGLALTPWLVYPLRAIFLSRLSLWQTEIDLPFYALASVIAVIVIPKLLVA